MILYDIPKYSKGAISGVVDVNDYPLNNIKVWLIGKDLNFTFTNCEGEFLFYDLVDGDYVIKIHYKGFSPYTKEVILRDGALINCEISLTVKPDNDIICSIARDELGVCIPYAFVGVYENKKLILATKTNYLGHYVIYNLPKGKYVVKIVTDYILVTYTIEK